MIRSHVIIPEGLRDPAEMGAIANGRLQVLPASFWARFSQQEIALFCVKNACYCIPTLELVGWLKTWINGRRALEIGSGNGALAEALNIPATDSHQQAEGFTKAVYEALGQRCIHYGRNVELLAADQATVKYKPEVILGAWVTHRYNPDEDWRGGNIFGIDERFMVARAEYVNIGHTAIHQQKPIWDYKHAVSFPPWLVSRALSEGRNYVAIWQKGARRES